MDLCDIKETLIKKAASSWISVCFKKLRIIYGFNNQIYTIEIVFLKEDFAHLAGFQYATDLKSIPRYNSKKILQKILDSSIRQAQIESAHKYQRMILPRLIALSNVSALIYGDISLYTYRPNQYSFHTELKADYCIKVKTPLHPYYFVIKNNNDPSFSCCSTFIEESRDYTANQIEFAILKKELYIAELDLWSTIYLSSKFH